jgi:type VI secretion system protein ImpE
MEASMSVTDALNALKAGNLQDTLQLLQIEVRKSPADSKLRVFLFQLLAVLGQWERSLTQLAVVGELDANATPMVHAYREAVRCEILRNNVFNGLRTPVIFGDPPTWIAQLINALRLDAEGQFLAAQQQRKQAFDAAPGVAGAIDGRPFAWLADADSRLGPVVELIANGEYFWIPTERIRSIRLEAPADLRDNVWMPVGLTMVNGGELIGFVPARYPVTDASIEDALLLGRRTDWIEVAPEVFHGRGQRMLTTDEDDFPLMNVRLIEFDTPVQSAN